MFEVGTKVSFLPEALEYLDHLNCTCYDVFTVIMVSSSFIKLEPAIADVEEDYTYRDFSKKFLKEVIDE